MDFLLLLKKKMILKFRYVYLKRSIIILTDFCLNIYIRKQDVYKIIVETVLQFYSTAFLIYYITLFTLYIIYVDQKIKKQKPPNVGKNKSLRMYIHPN